MALSSCLNGRGCDFAAQSSQHLLGDTAPRTWTWPGGLLQTLHVSGALPNAWGHPPLTSGLLQGLVLLLLPQKPEDRPT